jgi:hypothetical protein
MATPTPGRKYLSGLERFQQRRDPEDHWLVEVLPADPGVVHAIEVPFGGPPSEPVFLRGMGQVEKALCGKAVRVRLPLAFRPDDADEDQCGRCRGLARQGARAPDWDFRSLEPDPDRVPPTSYGEGGKPQWTFGAREPDEEGEPLT